jgi:hypothetical protein
MDQDVKGVEIDPRAVIDTFLNRLISCILDVLVGVNSPEQFSVDCDLNKAMFSTPPLA